MNYDITSLPAFLKSLGLADEPVNTKPGRMIAGPPAFVFELVLRLGLGGPFVDTPANRAILAGLNVPPELLAAVGRRVRSRSDWRDAWTELAGPHQRAAEAAKAAGDKAAVLRESETALNLLNLAYSGDGYYIHTPLTGKREALAVIRGLHQTLWDLNGEDVTPVVVNYRDGQTYGLLHRPAGADGRLPALLGLHPAGSDKESFDLALARFRAAGYATFCIDLPGHGQALEGPRLKFDSEAAGAAALDWLAAQPGIDPDRLAVAGGSLGAFYAQRTAAASPRARACLVYATPFDIGYGFRNVVPGIRELIMDAIGAHDLESACQMLLPFHLRDTIGQIRCPLALVHGTRDHICDFNAPYEIAKRACGPLSIFPIRGADHEVALPGTERLSAPGIAWLAQALA